MKVLKKKHALEFTVFNPFLKRKPNWVSYGGRIIPISLSYTVNKKNTIYLYDKTVFP